MNPLKIAFPLGIGDCHWVCTKLRGLSEYHDGRPVHAYVNTSRNHASVGYLQIVPQVEKAIQSERAIYLIHKDLPEPYKAPRWSTLEGCADWREFDYVLVPNGHLESGKPLATWLPEIPTEYSYQLAIPAADREHARSLAPAGSVLLYLSGVSANRGFHANTWTPFHWAEVIGLLNAAGVTPVLVGARTRDDQQYRTKVRRLLGKLDYVDTIGQTTIPQICAMIEDAAVWSGLNSGLGIVSAMRGTPTVMLWADSRYPIRGSSTYTMHHAMQRSWLADDQLETYRTFSYGSPGLTPAKLVKSLLDFVPASARRVA